VDRGFSYTSAIFYQTPEEKEIAEASKEALAASKRFEDLEIVTPIIAYTNFYPAEDYHQDFYIKSPIRYN
jgi:peptide methionine sulfoxide reductase MsrA